MSQQLGALAAPDGLDVDQELILTYRFEQALASFEGGAGDGQDEGSRAVQFEFERMARIATNMRGHIR